MNTKFGNASLALLALSALTLAACASSKEDDTMPPAVATESAPASDSSMTPVTDPAAMPPADSTTPPEESTLPPADSTTP